GAILIGLKILGEQLDDAAVVAVGDVETDDGRVPAASLHAVSPVRAHANGETDLLAGVMNGLDHLRFALHRTHAVDDPQAAHFAQRDAHGFFADRRHVGGDDGN